MSKYALLIVAIIFIMVASAPVMAMPVTEIGGFDHYTTATLTYVESDAGWTNTFGYMDDEPVLLGSNKDGTPDGSQYSLGLLAPGDTITLVDIVTKPAYTETVTDGYLYYYRHHDHTYYVESAVKIGNHYYVTDLTEKKSHAKLFQSADLHFHSYDLNDMAVTHNVEHPAVNYSWTSDGPNAQVAKNGQEYTVGFEDQPGLGDQDFNDMVLKVICTNVTGDLHVSGTTTNNLPNTLGNITATVHAPNGITKTYKVPPVGAMDCGATIELGEVYGWYTVDVKDGWRNIGASTSFIYQGMDTSISFSNELWNFNVRYFYAYQWSDPANPYPVIVTCEPETGKVVKVYIGPMESPYYTLRGLTRAMAAQWAENVYGVTPTFA